MNNQVNVNTKTDGNDQLFPSLDSKKQDAVEIHKEFNEFNRGPIK